MYIELYVYMQLLEDLHSYSLLLKLFVLDLVISLNNVVLFYT